MIITTSFIPLEVYELVKHESWMTISVVLVNALIVATWCAACGARATGRSTAAAGSASCADNPSSAIAQPR